MRLVQTFFIIICSSAFGLRNSRGWAWGGHFIRPIRAINIQSWQHPNHFYSPFSSPVGIYGPAPAMSGCIRGNIHDGCSICKPRLYIMFVKIGNRQMAVCEHTCPSGYVGVRVMNSNRCFKCRINNCVSCFTRDYCTKCRPEYFLYKGNCITSCPDNMFANIITQHCEYQVDCVVSEWSDWSNCLVRYKSAISCKRNKRRRSRMVLQAPSSGGKQCPKLKQKKSCRYSLPKCSANHRRRSRRRKRMKTNYRLLPKNDFDKPERLTTKYPNIPYAKLYFLPKIIIVCIFANVATQN